MPLGELDHLKAATSYRESNVSSYVNIVKHIENILRATPDWEYANSVTRPAVRTLREVQLEPNLVTGVNCCTAVLVPMSDPRPDYAYNLNPQAVIIVRPGRCETFPIATSNRVSFYSEFEVDVLFNGFYQPTGARGPEAVGIYHPMRGPLIQRLQGQLIRYTTLSFDGYDKTISDQGLAILDESGQPTGNIVEDNMTLRERYPVDSISQVTLKDGTDLSYWTLFWSYGEPKSFLGWWPSTITVCVNQNENVGYLGV